MAPVVRLDPFELNQLMNLAIDHHQRSLPGVGEVEALVGQREVGDDRVGQGHRERRPVEEGRIDHLDPDEPALFVELDPVHDRPPPALGDPHPSVGWVGHPLVRQPGDHVEWPAVGDEASEERQRCPNLVHPDRVASQHVPARLHRRRKLVTQVDERMGGPGVEGQTRCPADDTDDTEVSGVGLIERRRCR